MASTPAVDPLLEVRWFAEVLRVRTATGAEAPAAEPAQPEPPAAKPDAAKPEPPGRIRGLDLPRDLDRPVLVYFHWPHEDGDRGKRIVKFCTGPLDDQAFVLWTPLFHCVEINTRDSDARLVEEAKVRATPALAVCRPDGTVVWRTEDPGLSGKALAAALRKVLAESFPEKWAAVEKEIRFQKETLQEARRLLAARKASDALLPLGQVVGSEVRFTEEWAEARRLLRDAEKEAAEGAEK